MQRNPEEKARVFLLYDCTEVLFSMASLSMVHGEVHQVHAPSYRVLICAPVLICLLCVSCSACPSADRKTPWAALLSTAQITAAP